MCFRDDALEGRHILISGGCGAIGLEVVRKLADHGAMVRVNDLLEPAEAEARLREAEIDLENVGYVQADLTQVGRVGARRWSHPALASVSCASSSTRNSRTVRTRI